MIILDTNVVSESTKLIPSDRVIKWLRILPAQSTFITAITAMELWTGAAYLPKGKRREQIEQDNRLLMSDVYLNRVLPFDLDASEICGKLIADSKADRRNIRLPDIQIAAIALLRGFTLATRNVADFQFEGLKLIDPWTD